MIACAAVDVVGWTLFGGVLGLAIALACILIAQRKV